MNCGLLLSGVKQAMGQKNRGCFLLKKQPLFIEQVIDKYHLGKNNQRNESHKIPIAGFVIKEKQSGIYANATAQNGEQKKGSLRNSPQFVFSFIFVKRY